MPMVTSAPATVQAITRRKKQEDPFFFSPDLIEHLQLLTFARKVLAFAFRLLPLQLPSGRGRPDLYPDEVILVTLIVMRVWQLSPREMVRRLHRWPKLAEACGYLPAQVISASQLYRRRDQLGLWVYFVTFCALVWQLLQRGIIRDRDVVVDSTLVEAYSLLDLEAAWHFAKRFGYKVHMLICRQALLPLMFVVTPANRHDAPWRLLLLEMARRCFALPIRIGRADAAYFTRQILAYVCSVLHAHPIIDFNPRRRRKKALATLDYIAWWRDARGKRGYLERFFALLKRYFALNDVHAFGLYKVWQHTFEVCIAVLIVAWLATEIGRPDLMHSKSRLLAPC